MQWHIVFCGSSASLNVQVLIISFKKDPQFQSRSARQVRNVLVGGLAPDTSSIATIQINSKKKEHLPGLDLANRATHSLGKPATRRSRQGVFRFLHRPIQCTARPNSDRFHGGCMQCKHGENRSPPLVQQRGRQVGLWIRDSHAVPRNFRLGTSCAYRIGYHHEPKPGGSSIDATAETESASCRPAKLHRRYAGPGFQYLATKCDAQRYVYDSER